MQNCNPIFKTQMKFISTVAALAATSYSVSVEMTADDFYSIQEEKERFEAAIDELEEVWDDAQDTL